MSSQLFIRALENIQEEEDLVAQVHSRSKAADEAVIEVPSRQVAVRPSSTSRTEEESAFGTSSALGFPATRRTVRE
jgi:hypothetical protein